MNDKWLRLIGYPVVIFLSARYFHPEALLLGGWSTLRALATSGIFTVITWEGNRAIIRYCQRRFAGYTNTFRRVLAEASGVIVYSFVVQVLLELILFYGLDLHPAGAPPVNWWACVLSSLIPLPLFGLVYEAGYFFREWKKSIQQSEALARSQVQAQFDALKKQLDPHFLFNSLNTLAYLIDLENEPAQEYLSRLSDVYRYVLETRQHATVSLADELAFLEDYLYLNKVRHRDHFQVETILDPACQHQKVPALSLQLLVENALKHNEASAERPLHISISSEPEGIRVSNNKQPRPSLIQSTRVGLQNLTDQYRLLTSRPVEIRSDGTRFEVFLPYLERTAV